jgi:diacylglycerol kinase (ATP)
MDEKESVNQYLEEKDLSNCEAIFIAGGDGSVNSVISHMMKHDLDIPIGILPAGTSNDFASYLGISENLSEAIDDLSSFRWRRVDIGKVNSQYFINVCGGGFFTNVAHTVDMGLKETFGKLAYYVKGVQQASKFRPLHFRFTVDGVVYDESIYLFLLMNTQITGGFGKLAIEAKVDDGKMDLVVIRETPINAVLTLFSKVLQGEHLESEYVLYIQCTTLKVECLNEMEDFEDSDIDGEQGPTYPLDITVLKEKIRVLY